MSILDFHCHFSPAFFRFREYQMDASRLLEEMDAHDVVRAVVSAAGEFAAYAVGEGNDGIADLVAAHPGRFIGFCTVNPWMRSAATKEVHRSADRFAKGLVLHPLLQGFEANDPLVFPVVEAAISRGLAIYITSGAPILAMPYKVADLAERYPEGRFVLGHAGWDFHFDVLYCLQACPNLWAETSKNELCNLEAIVRTVGVDRLLFGSDYPFSTYTSEIEKIRLLPGLSDDDTRKLFSENALALLGLEAGR